MEQLYGELTARENAASKELADHNQKLEQLHKALEERAPNAKRNILTMPVIDAFGSPLRLIRFGCPQLTLNNNFRDVARFDRCTTCHQAMDKTQPGSAIIPGYQHEFRLELTLPSPNKEQAQEILDAVVVQEREDEEQGQSKSQHEQRNDRLARFYGFRISERGLLNDDDATISVVLPETLALRKSD